jgi:hypothetical protein
MVQSFELAAKAASHELKGAIGYSSIPELRVPTQVS